MLESKFGSHNFLHHQKWWLNFMYVYFWSLFQKTYNELIFEGHFMIFFFVSLIPSQKKNTSCRNNWKWWLHDIHYMSFTSVFNFWPIYLIYFPSCLPCVVSGMAESPQRGLGEGLLWEELLVPGHHGHDTRHEDAAAGTTPCYWLVMLSFLFQSPTTKWVVWTNLT